MRIEPGKLKWWLGPLMLLTVIVVGIFALISPSLKSKKGAHRQYLIAEKASKKIEQRSAELDKLVDELNYYKLYASRKLFSPSEVPSFIKTVITFARNTHTEIVSLRLQPRGSQSVGEIEVQAKAKAKKEEKKPAFTLDMIEVNLTVAGRYFNLMRFLQALTNIPRLITFSNLRLTPVQEGSEILHLGFNATIYAQPRIKKPAVTPVFIARAARPGGPFSPLLKPGLPELAKPSGIPPIPRGPSGEGLIPPLPIPVVTTPQPPEPVISTFRLYGIIRITGTGESIAILAAGEEFYSVAVGEELPNQVIVKAITPNSVTLLSGRKQIKIKLDEGI